MATDTYATVEVLLDYNNGNSVFMWFVPKCYKQVSQVPEWKLVSSSVVNWKSTCEEKTRRWV
jgi:hypothetical protein